MEKSLDSFKFASLTPTLWLACIVVLPPIVSAQRIARSVPRPRRSVRLPIPLKERELCISIAVLG
jgi:hypothetical protein